MDKTIKAEWIAALESGEYNQAIGRLHERRSDGSEGFCCLGVLCDIAVKHDVIPEPSYQESNSTYEYVNSTALLPIDVVRWARMATSDGEFNDGESLTARNDEGSSFVEIADLIREYF